MGGEEYTGQHEVNEHLEQAGLRAARAKDCGAINTGADSGHPDQRVRVAGNVCTDALWLTLQTHERSAAPVGCSSESGLGRLGTERIRMDGTTRARWHKKIAIVGGRQ